ncbi:MAG: cell division protein FtsL [candidate division KSB1 bacterium]|nr:cell division protein FtsL [candidate division KSB1 bacterium]MDZ7333882.1 cell division protein FtsL [candidate division KSB1 bacterium]MDZ7358998.1 cell division protein FtsL [candidate division KSB1 bacterium]MDZ7377692.1 cell division protein FtsL [candidate division KSB1 bacterium]MDZ7399128.1 cell division protein FtsL [candidate division KSB1 bacterium]
MSGYVKRRRTLVRSIDQVQQELARPTSRWLVLVGILIIALILVGLVWQKVKIAQLIQEIEQLEKQLTYYKETNEKLQGRVLHLSREDRIVSIARTKLNMSYPPYEIVRIPMIKHGSEVNK